MEIKRAVVISDEMVLGMTAEGLQTLCRYMVETQGHMELGAYLDMEGFSDQVRDEVLRWESGILLVGVPGALIGPQDKMKAMEAANARTRAAMEAKVAKTEKASVRKKSTVAKLYEGQAKRELVDGIWTVWMGAWSEVFGPLGFVCRGWSKKDEELVSSWHLKDGYSIEDISCMVYSVVHGWEILRKHYKGRLTAEVPTIPILHGFREDFMAMSKKGMSEKAIGEFKTDGNLPEAWRE